MERLPEGLRKILLAYVAPLNKAVAVLLQQSPQQQKRGDDYEEEEEREFERNFKVYTPLDHYLARTDQIDLIDPADQTDRTAVHSKSSRVTWFFPPHSHVVRMIKTK